MEVLVILAYLEICVVVLALLSNTLFSFIIYQASSLHFNCRNLLILFSVSIYLLDISHGLTVFEFLFEKQTYYHIYFVSVRGITWRFLHEFGYSLQSLSLFLFSIERLIASLCPTAYRSFKIRIWFIFSLLGSIIISIGFSYTVHMGQDMFSPTVAMTLVDISSCIFLIIAWQKSLSHYRSTVGVLTLNQRFQLSDVYTWSRHLIPAVLLASLSKFMCIITIWVLITSNFTENQAAIWIIAYNNILNIYAVILPFVILLKNRKIREKLIHAKAQSLDVRKTIDGREIPRKHDYFEYLKQNWK